MRLTSCFSKPFMIRRRLTDHEELGALQESGRPWRTAVDLQRGKITLSLRRKNERAEPAKLKRP